MSLKGHFIEILKLWSTSQHTGGEGISCTVFTVMRKITGHILFLKKCTGYFDSFHWDCSICS